MRIRTKESGYFLVVILFFIHIFSMIVLHELSSLKNEWVHARKKWQIISDNILSEHVLIGIEKGFANRRNACIISERNSAMLKGLSRSEWRKIGCQVTMKQTVYWYVIEHLAHDPCAVSLSSDVQPGMSYYRISLLRHESASVLQSIIALNDHQEVCVGTLHHRMQGRQSWQEL